MRRARQIGFLAVVAAGTASALWFALHPSDLVRDAQVSLARGDLHAAQLDLDSFLKGHPHDPGASFQLGLVALAQDNGIAAERNFRVASDAGYDKRAIVVPLGRAYALQRHYDQALADFTLQDSPADLAPQVQTVRALAWLGLHRVEEARAAIEDALRRAPDDADAGLVAARVALAGNRAQAAGQAIAHVLALHPDRADARLLQADVTLAQGDPKASLQQAQEILAHAPDRADAKMAAARALAALQRDDEAVALLDQVRHVAPRRVDARYLRAILAVRHQDYATADTQLAGLSPVIDQLPLGNYLLAVTKLARAQPDQAEAAASAYAARHPDDAAAHKLLALSELSVGRPDRALDALHGLLQEARPDVATLDLQARALAMQGHVADAAQSLSLAAALAPGNTDVLNRLAAARLRLGDTTQGAEALRQSLAAVPDQPQTAERLVQASLQAGDLKGAQAAVRGLREAAGDTELVGVLDGAVRAASLDFAGARQAYTQVLKQSPASRGATFGLIQLDRLSGDESAAQDLLATWVQSHPADPDGLAMAVADALRGGNVAQAIALQEAAHAAAPADRPITERLARLYMDNHQPQKAVALLGRAAATGDTSWLALQAEAQARNSNPAEATRLFLQAADARPKDPGPRLGLVALKLQARDYDGAKSVIAEALADNPGNPRLLQAAVEVEQLQGGLKAALARAASLRADPKQAPASYTLAADLLAASGDKTGAADEYLAAFRQAPSSPLAIAAAAALARAGRPDSAGQILQHWVAAHPDDVGALQILASLAITAQHMDEAARWLRQVLAHSPNNAVALNNLAWVELSQGDLGAAYTLAQRAYVIAPGPDTQDTLGWVMARQGNATGALGLLQQAAAAKPGQSILYHQAFALHAAGRTDDAKAALDRALQDPHGFAERGEAERLRKLLGS